MDAAAGSALGDRVPAYAVYLLTTPKGHPTYIGSTHALDRRLRQHNGLIKGGAQRTKRAQGTWRRAAFVHGFASRTEALRFEWAWQHPTRSTVWRALVQRRGFTLAKRLEQVRAVLAAVPAYAHLHLVLTAAADPGVCPRTT